MLKINSFAVIGGDKRQEYLVRYLRGQDYIVTAYNGRCDSGEEYSLHECMEGSDAVILPLPVSKDNKTVYSSGDQDIALYDVLSDSLKGKIVFGGKPTAEIKEYMDKNGITFYDYYEMEDMTVKNAIVTAEGAAAVAILNKPVTLYNSDCLVAGYGRIGKALVRILQSFGARVTVALRKSSDRAWALMDGVDVIGYEDLRRPCHFDFIFNTVPHIVFTKPELVHLNRDALIIDLASFPGGVDIHQAKCQGIEVLTASALPSKFSPQSAGEFIAQSIINTIKEDV